MHLFTVIPKSTIEEGSRHYCASARERLVLLLRSMWQQNYTPIANSLALSTLVAAIPIFVLLFLIGIRRKPAWMASLAGLGATVVLAAAVYRMPFGMLVSSVFYGAAFGLLP